MNNIINLEPTKCKVYGKEYGSGRIYYCTRCHAYVGTHKPRPREALGILANPEMRALKSQCHTLFDPLWKCKPTQKECFKERKAAYRWLAEKMGIPRQECHFGYFNMDRLQQAYQILKEVGGSLQWK